MKRERPTPIVRLTGGALSPVCAYSAEELAAYPAGTEFDLKPRSKRSLPHHRLYWQLLAKAVEATERWPTAEVLHDAVKANLGYIRPIYDMHGIVTGYMPMSIAFEEMNQREFAEYFERAMALLAEALVYDPLANV